MRALIIPLVIFNLAFVLHLASAVAAHAAPRRPPFDPNQSASGGAGVRYQPPVTTPKPATPASRELASAIIGQSQSASLARSPSSGTDLEWLSRTTELPSAARAANNRQAIVALTPQQTSIPIPSNPYTNATHTILLDLRQQLVTRAIKFDEHFRSLLTQSKLSLHNMFVATYGMMYEHNTEIFTSMYESLEQYYATGQIELTKSMESFFERLYQKIFQVVNSNRAFAPIYLECATDQLASLKPFRDAPEKLIVDIRHALVAARTFNQALNAAIDIIKNIISVSTLSLV